MLLIQHLEKTMQSLTYFQEVKNEHFINRSFFIFHLVPGKTMCCDCNSISDIIPIVYRLFKSWKNAKATRVGFQWVPLTGDAERTSQWLRHFLNFVVLECFLVYLMRSSLGTLGNSPKIIRTKNIHHSFVNSGGNFWSI